MLVICNKANHPDCPKCNFHCVPHHKYCDGLECCTEYGECQDGEGNVAFKAVRCVNIRSKTGRKICEDLGYEVDRY